MRRAFFLLLLFSSCQVHKVYQHTNPPVPVPEQFVEETAGKEVQGKWWEEFQISSLDDLITHVQENNLDLRVGWDRLIQAKALTRIARADLYPHLDVAASARWEQTLRDNRPSDQRARGDGDLRERYILSTIPSYEVDLWKKISHRACAAQYNWRATYEEYEATALLLSGVAFDFWLIAQEQWALLRLLEQQVASNETRVELLELRLSVGEATVLDVYQQQLQLASTREQVPNAESLLRTAANQLAVLMGYPPEDQLPAEYPILSIELPPFPEKGVPALLLQQRPDLRASQRRVTAADHELGAAIAERLPSLRTGLSYDFVTSTIKKLFEQELLSIVADLLEPVFDGGRRAGEELRRRAVLSEQIHRFGQDFLVAVQEVEDAVVQEKYKREQIERIEEEIEIAEKNVQESTIRYTNGLVDYLDVVAAISSLQDLQRRQISEHRNLLQIRGNLYRSLGGSRVERCPS